MNLEEWLKEHTVNIIVGILGIAGGIYVFWLHSSIAVYESKVSINQENIKVCLEKIKDIDQKLKELTGNKSCDCAAYNIILKNHEGKIESLTKALKQKLSEQSAEEN